MMEISSVAKKLKVTTVVTLPSIIIPDNALSRYELRVSVGGRVLIADLATKSLRKTLKVIDEHGADNVVVILQGVLAADNRVDEAGLTAQVKTPVPQAAA